MKKERWDRDDFEQCWACGVALSKKARELHHYPIAKRIGGENVIPICMPCHDMVDRIGLDRWPMDWFTKVLLECPREIKLYTLKLMSKHMPTEILDAVPFGWRIEGDAFVRDETEQRIIGMVRSLRADGMTHAQIADELNERGINYGCEVRNG